MIDPNRPLVPNETTIAAIEEARAGNLRQFKNAAELLETLNAEKKSMINFGDFITSILEGLVWFFPGPSKDKDRR